MPEVLKEYVSHGSVQMLFAALAACLYAITALALWAYWPWALVVIASAPFFEWVTHKYTLHRDLTENPVFGAIIRSGCIMVIICILNAATCNSRRPAPLSSCLFSFMPAMR